MSNVYCNWYFTVAFYVSLSIIISQRNARFGELFFDSFRLLTGESVPQTVNLLLRNFLYDGVLLTKTAMSVLMIAS